MLRVSWKGNKIRGDNTTKMVFTSERQIVRGGEGEMTQREYDKYSDRYDLNIIDDDSRDSSSGSSSGSKSSSSSGSSSSIDIKA